MRIKRLQILSRTVGMIGLILGSAGVLQAQSNVWTNTVSGKWETATDWSLGAPSSSETVLITNAATKTVTIDGATATNFTSTMTVSNLNLIGSAGTTNILSLTNAGPTIPLEISNTLTLAGDSAMTMDNSTMQVDAVADLYVAHVGTGGGAASFTLNSGSARFRGTYVQLAEANSMGTINLNGGTLVIDGSMFGGFSSATGIVNVAGGTLFHTNNQMIIPYTGAGHVNVSGGLLKARALALGGSGGDMTISGGTVSLAEEQLSFPTAHLIIGDVNFNSPCYVTVLTNGLLTVTNAAQLGRIDVVRGALILNGGKIITDDLTLTNGGHFTNLAGTFELTPKLKVDNGSSAVLAGGTNIFDGGVAVGSTTGSTGTVSTANAVVNVPADFTAATGTNSAATITFGTNSVVNIGGTLAVGPVGAAQVLLGTGATLIAPTIKLGGLVGIGAGDLITQPGSFMRFHFVSANYYGPGGDADGTGGSVVIGDAHPNGLMHVPGGSVTNLGFLTVGNVFGGTFLQDGGLTIVNTNMTVGSCDVGSVGAATVSGGTMYVTNAAHTAMLIVSNGAFVLAPGGHLVVDTLVLTNPCGLFTNNGGPGALQVLVRTNLDLNLSAVGDGIPNGWKLAHGFDPLDPGVASADPDQDGANNLSEYLAGTDPNNAQSVFRTTGGTIAGQDVRVSWTTEPGHSYVVQTNGDLGTGTFRDVSGVVPAPGGMEASTNYLDVGGATKPRRFYRIRLGP